MATLSRSERRQARRRSDQRIRMLVAAVGAVAGVAVGGIGAAFGYWLTTDSSNVAQAVSARLSAPTSPTARESGPVTITVGWTLPAHQLNGAQYLVTRTSGPGSPATVCKVTVTSCSDSGLASGTAYAYSVMAVLGTNWQSATLTASATTLGVSTTSLAGATAGAPYAVTLGATGGSGSYAHWALATGILPSWATLDPATGTLSGTPNTAGDTFGIAFTVTDSNGFNATSGALSLAVSRASTTTGVALSPSSSITYGDEQAVTFNVTVSPRFAGDPTGRVQVKTGAVLLCTGTLDAFGHASCHAAAAALVSAGTPYLVTAVYAGDANDVGSTATGSQSLTVDKAPTTTTVVSNHNPLSAGQQVTVTATVSVTGPDSGSPSANDTLTFEDGGNPMTCATGSTAFNSAAATCLITFTSDADSPHLITAVFAGDPNYSASTSATLGEGVISAPGPPGSVAVVDNGCVLNVCTVTVNLAAPVSDGGSPVVLYQATCSSSDGGTAAGPVPGTGTSVLVLPLTEGKTYTCSVTAINLAGIGPPGTSASFVA